MATDAELIALARALWPGVTTAVASDATLTAWLPWARGMQAAVSWGDLYDTGIACLLAHAGLRSPASGSVNPGPTTSKSTLGMSQSWGHVATTSLLESDLSTTSPGLRWLQIRGTLVDYLVLPPLP